MNGSDRKSAGIGKGTPGPGRTKGRPNNATLQAREAIARFVDGNAHRLQDWLDDIAGGVPKPDAEGEYIVAPQPARAFELFQSVIEYHIPKLARTEHTGANGGAIRVVASAPDEAI